MQPKSTKHITARVSVSIIYVLVMFMVMMDSTIANVALPSIAHDFHVTAVSLSLVALGYLIACAITIPLSGWMGQRYGQRNMLLLCIAVFTLASGLCATASQPAILILYRVLQGLAGGMITPIGMGMLFSVFPPEERVRVSSIVTFPAALAPVIGPILGGVLVNSFSWHWVFLINLPIGVAALLFGLATLPNTEQLTRRFFDFTGFVFASGGLVLLVYGMGTGPSTGWSTPSVLAATFGILLLITLIPVELRKENPMLHLPLYKDSLFRVCTTIVVCAAGGLQGSLYLISILFQDALGYSPIQTGLASVPEAVGVLLGIQLTSRILYPAFGPRRLILFGMLGIGATCALMSEIELSSPAWLIPAILFCMGFAFGFVQVSLQAASFATIPKVQIPHASTLFSILRQAGSALGIAVLTTVFYATNKDVNRLALVPYHHAFLAAACLSVLGAFIAIWVSDKAAEITRRPIHRKSND